EEEGRTTLRKWERVPVKFRYPLPLPPQRSAVSGHNLHCLQSLKTTGPFTKLSASRACAVGTRL
ncbi:unnamed protein product, partial [Staurois parvus]